MASDPHNLRGYEAEWAKVRRNLIPAQVAAIHMLSAPLTAGEIALIEAKGRTGWVEHNGGIVHMTPDQLLWEARGECRDLLWYMGKWLG
jgi:hypothetical protein